MARFTLLVAILLASGIAHAQGPSTSVGFRQIEFRDVVTGQRVPLFVWYPTSQASRPTQFGPYTLDVARGASPAAGRHRLVMISHGTGGDPLSHARLGMDLARRGYVAAAPRHAKDNSRDWSGVGTYEVWYGRPRQISEGTTRFSPILRWARLSILSASRSSATRPGAIPRWHWSAAAPT